MISRTCMAPRCFTHTKGAYCYTHAKQRGFLSAQESVYVPERKDEDEQGKEDPTSQSAPVA